MIDQSKKSAVAATPVHAVDAGSLADAVAGAPFLEDFVPADIDWLHIDLFAWNDAARPGRPVGGDAQTVCTLLAFLEERYPA